MFRLEECSFLFGEAHQRRELPLLPAMRVAAEQLQGLIPPSRGAERIEY